MECFALPPSQVPAPRRHRSRWKARTSERRYVSHHLPLAREPAEVVVGRARALAGDHARPDRPLRRAGRAEPLALPRLDDALEHLTALAGLRIGDADAGDLVAQLGVEVRVRVGEPQTALGDEPHPAPLEVRPKREPPGEHLEPPQVALVRDDAAVLVL